MCYIHIWIISYFLCSNPRYEHTIWSIKSSILDLDEKHYGLNMINYIKIFFELSESTGRRTDP